MVYHRTCGRAFYPEQSVVAMKTTVLVDDRIGSGNMVGLLRHWSVPVDCVRLDFGDAAFIGNGPDGPTRIGIEIKAVKDAVSCMVDGRFASQQLPGLVSEYDKVWMLVEGPY